MRKLALLSVVLLSAVAVAAPTMLYLEWATSGTAQPCSSGTCTRSAPTLATDGMNLVGIGGFRLKICAASGQTLSGAGTMLAYAYDVNEGVWARNKDLDQSVTLSGSRCQTFPDFIVTTHGDRVLFAASGVTVSGGAGLDVLITGQTGAQ